MEFITSGDRIATENFSIGKIYTVTFTNGNYFINTCVGIGPDFVMFQQEAPKMLFCLDMESAETVATIDESGGGAGTMNYNELDNKPSINGVPLIGNKTAADLSILPVPIVGENDNNKILTASYSGGVGSYSWQPAPSSGTTDYTQLTNKPQINSVELNGNKSLADLGIASAEALAGKQDVISDLNTIRSGAAAGATAVQPATLAGYQTLIDSSHKLSSDLVDDTGNTNKFATAAQLAQIETNKNNISLCKAFTDNASIDSNRKLYISATEPTGDIPQGSTWIDGKTIKTYGRSDNLWDESYPNISSEFRYIGINVGTGKFTLSTTTPQTEYATLCFIAGNVDSGASTGTNGVWTGQSRTVTAIDGYVTIAYRVYGQSPVNYNTMLNAGDTAETYQSYYDWV